ncbi:MAG: tyrosine-type recombinase/integrase, partial [Mariprofundus sp.]
GQVDQTARGAGSAGGCGLLISKTSKCWRMDYRMAGKRKTLTIGTYPEIPLAGCKDKSKNYCKGARDYRTEAKQLITMGIDPSQKKQADRQECIAKQARQQADQDALSNTFEVVAREWHALHRVTWTDKHASTTLRRFELHVFPMIGAVPVAQLTKALVANVITKVSSTGKLEMAHRVAQITRQVLEYAADKEIIDNIPLGRTKNLLPRRKAVPMPAITEPKRIGEFMRSIYTYEGTFIVCQALKLLPLVATRSAEFRNAEWPEFDLDGALWTIPAMHRKILKEDKLNPTNVHLVPLSRQAIEILREIKLLTGNSRYVFPSFSGKGMPMSENAVNDAIERMGYKGEMVGHGVRAMFSTSMNAQGFNADAIERQLAHKEKDAVRAAYNRAEYLSERVRMMQHWADYLDGLRLGANIIPLHQKKQLVA